MFPTLCPHCRSQLTAVDNLVGHTMLCPLCHRPFVATPVSLAPPSNPATMEMPVTARARSRQASPAKIALTVVSILLCIAVSIPLVICLGLTSRVQKIRDKIAKQDEDLSAAARMAVVEHGYTDVRLKGTPLEHDLGYQAEASGIDKWAQKHQLSIVFRYNGQLIEVLMLKEGNRYKVLSADYESWSGN